MAANPLMCPRQREQNSVEETQMLAALLPSLHTHLLALATKPTAGSDRSLATVRGPCNPSCILSTPSKPHLDCKDPIETPVEFQGPH